MKFAEANRGSTIQWERMGKYQPYPVRPFLTLIESFLSDVVIVQVWGRFYLKAHLTSTRQYVCNFKVPGSIPGQGNLLNIKCAVRH